MSRNYVKVSPHIASPVSTQNIMADVLIALAPPVVAAVAIFGLYPLLVVLVSVSGAVLGEFLFCKIAKKQHTLNDLSAVVTGVILGLNLPPVVPLYLPLVGGFFATMVVKMLFGGLGKNFANPAITARIFLLLAWSGMMSSYVLPVDWAALGAKGLFSYFTKVNAVTGATPLSVVDAGNMGTYTLLDMFLGRTGGAAGETCALAIAIGAAYLLAKRVIDWRIPLVIIGTVAVCSFLFNNFDFSMILPNLLSGGLLFGCVYMATDYATSPNTKVGIYIYAFGVGLLTIIVRKFANMPEGMSFAILLMNIVTPLLDRYIVPRPFGYVKPPKQKKSKKEAA